MILLLDFDLISDKVLDERAEITWLTGCLGVCMQVVSSFVTSLHEHIHGFCLSSINLFQPFY